MTTQRNFTVYSGEGRTIIEREWGTFPYEMAQASNHPAAYIADKGLRDAVNVALALGQPLLVTGEPGTGKTQLASSIAYELGLADPFTFHTKTTSTAKDLLYRYDALKRFHDLQFRQENLSTEHYIEYEALGLAILLSLPQKVREFLPDNLANKPPCQSVVLIDEVDKAPRDFPNDLLDEIESMSFTVKETGTPFTADRRYRPILVLTSNSEKNLPDAFLRRCIYYNISFPESDKLKEITRKRLNLESNFTGEMLNNAIEHFQNIRDLALKKKPATAEFLAWVRILSRLGLDVNNLKPGEKDDLLFTYSILAKNKEDKEILEKVFK